MDDCLNEAEERRKYFIIVELKLNTIVLNQLIIGRNDCVLWSKGDARVS